MTENGTHGMFWESAPKFQKIKSDILDLFNIQNSYKISEEEVNSRCVSTLLNTANWTKLIDKKYADYAIGTPTLELWAESWNKKYSSQERVEYDGGKLGYYLGADGTNPDYTMSLSNTVGYKDTLYYPHSFIYKGCRGYWLASPSDNVDYNLVTVSYNGLIGNEDYSFTSCGLRPVVALKTTVTAELNEETGMWELSER